MLRRVKSEIELLERHLEVLKAVFDCQPIGIMKLSELTGLPYHRIRYSLRVLEQLGCIRASTAGAIATPHAEDLLRDLDRELDELVQILQSLKKQTEQMQETHNV
jgi:predicted transcriptional regulator